MTGETPNNSNQPPALPAICPDCGKVQREIKEGSLTSWIFLESRCQCAIIGKQPDPKSPPVPAPQPANNKAPNAIPFPVQPDDSAPAPVPRGPGSWPKPSSEAVRQPLPAVPPAFPRDQAPPIAPQPGPQATPISGPQSAAPVQYDLIPPSPQGAAQILLAVGAQAQEAPVKRPAPVKQQGGWPSPTQTKEARHSAPQPPIMEAPSRPASAPPHQNLANPAQFTAPPPPPSHSAPPPTPRLEPGPPPPPPGALSQAQRPAPQGMPAPNPGQQNARPLPAPHDDALNLVDKVIGRHYRILELIGQGGMSRVYRANHLLLNRTVAVKYINPKFVHDHKSVQRFQQEAKAAAALKHPNICAVNEFGMDEEGRPFLVMDFVDGISLSDVLKKQRPLTPEHALMIVEQVCQALAHAHGYGVIHRDIKPANIVLTRNVEGKEIVKLVDFGLAKLTDPEDEKRQNLTKTGEVLGTPFYMSPEQCIGRKVDVRSDLYSVGCVLFELLSGRPPFQSDNTVMTLMAHVNEAPPVLPENVHSPLVSRIVDRCLKKDPDQRFQSCAELLKELGKAQTIADNGGSEPQPDSIDVIGQRYQILEMIGQGGMGTVLKARHIALSKLVAIKVLNPGRNFDEKSRKRFEQEAQAGSKLAHPNLVAVFDYGYTARREPYLVMEYIDGDSLEKLVARTGPLEIDQFLEVFRQACKALNYIHKNGIVHRDVKPSNIIVQVIEGDSYVKLLDFGVAKILQEGAASQQLTATGMIFGSPLYMSPEQCIGRSIDLRSDIYSLGCVMYECIAGQPPHQGDNSLHTLHMHINERAPELGLASKGQAAARIEAIIKRCLEKDPEARFQTAPELLVELNAVDNRNSSGFFTAPNSAPQAVSPPNNQAGPAASPRAQSMNGADRSQAKAPSDINQRMVQFDLMSRSQPDKTRSSSGEQSAKSSGRSTDGATTQSQMRQPSLAASSPHATWLKLAIPLVVAAIAIGFVYPPTQLLANLSLFGGTSGNETANKSFLLGEESFKKGRSSYNKAVSHFEAALKAAEPVRDSETIGKVFARLGRINLEKELYVQASGDFKKAIKALKPKMAANKEYYLDSVYGMAQSLSAQRSYERAEEYFSEARKLASTWEKESKQADILFESARNESHNNPKDALEFYDQAIALFRRLPDKQYDKLAACLVESADILDSTGDTQTAVTRAKEALGYADEPGDFREIEERANDLIQRSTGDTVARERKPERERTPVRAFSSPMIPSQLSVVKPIEVPAPSTIYQNPIDTSATKVRTDSIQHSMRMLDNLRKTQTVELQRAQDAMKVPSIPASTLQPSFRSVSPSLQNYSAPAVPTYTASTPSYSASSVSNYSTTPSISNYSTTSSFPRYTTPSIPHYSAPSIPHYSTPSIPHYSTPSIPHYSTPSIPSYTTPTIPHYSAPSIPSYSSSSWSHTSTPSFGRSSFGH